MDGQLHNNQVPQIAILDFGSQLSHLIARRVRELNVFCELYSCKVDSSVLRQNNVFGVILSGGPSSVYETDAPHLSKELWDYIFENKLPVLGICYGLQDMMFHFGGTVEKSEKREFGFAEIEVKETESFSLFQGITEDLKSVWMSHGDKVLNLPTSANLSFETVASTTSCEFAAVQCIEEKLFGVQFHPEVTHSKCGTLLLSNFCIEICKAPSTWNMENIEEKFISQIKEQVGESHVIGAVSGGVDSTVAAVLLTRAIGEKFHAVFVDNGLLRKNEADEVMERLTGIGINIIKLDASERFLLALKGVTEPEKKRKIIGNLFIELFQEKAKEIEKSLDDSSKIEFLLQGTLYPDVIESISYKGPSALIKTHHNVGGLPEKMHLKLVEPMRELFKDEVRSLGLAMGIEKRSINRHPFPGPGLAIRILGEVTKERCDILRECDFRLIEELHRANVYDDIGQAFCVFLPVKSVGVMGDGRTYENVVSVRCVTTTDFMTADWYHMDYKLLGSISNRIINEVPGINRVCYDISSKPPSTIEWE